METASFYAGVQHKRYSVQREPILAKMHQSFALKNNYRMLSGKVLRKLDVSCVIYPRYAW